MKKTLTSQTAQDLRFYEKKRKYEAKIGHAVSTSEFERDGYDGYSGNAGTLSATGVSIFDPVLCEISYEWYTKGEDRILDPFAGGSVRGVVASKLHRHYTGVDLRQEQIDADIAQGEQICEVEYMPRWICGDSSHIDELVDDSEYDYIFTCPPYADLEVYSDDPADISNMSIDDFFRVYEIILVKAVKKLTDNRFATIVIGEARGRDGYYYNLVGKTIDIMQRAGCGYYNEQILVTPVGSLPIRVGKQFSVSRKLGKTHQNVLTFCKGNGKIAAQRLGDVYIPPIEEANDDE